MMAPEQQWIATHPGPVTLAVRLPNDASNPASVKALKQQISEMQGKMPVSKMQLKHPVHGFLKDAQTLGYYNLMSGMELQLSVRSRGGRK